MAGETDRERLYQEDPSTRPRSPGDSELFERAVRDVSAEVDVGPLDDGAKAGDLRPEGDFWDRVEAQVEVLRKPGCSAD